MYITISNSGCEKDKKVSRDCANIVAAIPPSSAQLFLLFGTKKCHPALRIVQRNANADL
jgi:hypothetical protein